MLEGTCRPRLSFTNTLTRIWSYLFLKHNDVLGGIESVLREYQNTYLWQKKERTLAGQSLIQQLLHSGLERRKGRKLEQLGGARHMCNQNEPVTSVRDDQNAHNSHNPDI